MKNATTKCSRCNGSGRLTCYAHIANGVCFGCGGAGSLGAEANAPSVVVGAWALAFTGNVDGEAQILRGLGATELADAKAWLDETGEMYSVTLF